MTRATIPVGALIGTSMKFEVVPRLMIADAVPDPVVLAHNVTSAPVVLVGNDTPISAPDCDLTWVVPVPVMRTGMPTGISCDI